MDRRLEPRILELARSQHRNVTRQQLMALGLGRAAISHRARSGRLHRVFTNVYAVGTPAASPVERAAAAVLACGDGAALSHASALFLWGLQRRWSEPIHVTTFRNRRRPGIVVHVSRVLTPEDLRSQPGIRMTSPARTVLDCAPELGGRLPRVIDNARNAGLLGVEQLAELIRRWPRHPGAAAVAAHLGLTAGPTRSDFELAFLAFCAQFGLPAHRSMRRSRASRPMHGSRPSGSSSSSMAGAFTRASHGSKATVNAMQSGWRPGS